MRPSQRRKIFIRRCKFTQLVNRIDKFRDQYITSLSQKNQIRIIPCLQRRSLVGIPTKQLVAPK